jgi:carbonic anhydrase
MRKFFLFLPIFSLNLLCAGDSLDRLVQGNKRFAEEKLEHPNRSAERREAVESKQEPFAVIVGCSDSRVAPEILFDQGVGDLFVVRVAGNVVGPLELDSIEYSVLHLHSSVIMVMGHENCGAVDAVIQKKDQTIEQIAELIAPAIADVKKEKPKEYLASCTKANAIAVRNYLVKTPIIKKLMDEKKVEVVPAYYNMTTGYVEIL